MEQRKNFTDKISFFFFLPSALYCQDHTH
jgi:hypothetical protein